MSDKTMREQFEEWYAKSYCPDVTAEHRMQRNYSWAAWQAALAQREAQEPVALDCYDAGLLNDFGGGNVEWWRDYIRAELARAHDFYQSQMSPPSRDPVVVAARGALAALSQSKTYPADIEAAKKWLGDALSGYAAPSREVPEEWVEAVKEFVDRCDRGEIRSKKTYAKFRALLASKGGA